ANQMMFDFIFHAIQLLDMQKPVNSDFHLYFLIRLSQHLGFYPQMKGRSPDVEGETHHNLHFPIFNLQEGTFQSSAPIHPYYIEPPLTEIFQNLLRASADFSLPFKMTINEKRILTEKLIEYYQLHLAGFSGIKSHKVLEEVWN